MAAISERDGSTREPEGGGGEGGEERCSSAKESRKLGETAKPRKRVP
jgi:hypothetical protein